jgi:hypothetical protein
MAVVAVFVSLVLRRVVLSPLLLLAQARPTEDKGLARGGEVAFRDSRRPMRPSQRIELAGLVVEVASIKEDGRPWEVRFRFDVPLEDPSLRWLQWTSDAYAPFRPPGVGGTVEFTAAGVKPDRAHVQAVGGLSAVTTIYSSNPIISRHEQSQSSATKSSGCRSTTIENHSCPSSCRSFCREAPGKT